MKVVDQKRCVEMIRKFQTHIKETLREKPSKERMHNLLAALYNELDSLKLEFPKGESTKESEVKELGGNWFSFTLNELHGQAKVFDEGSEFGIDGGRVSKLWISRNGKAIYDRGLDFDETKKGELKKVLNFLTKLIGPESK